MTDAPPFQRIGLILKDGMDRSDPAVFAIQSVCIHQHVDVSFAPLRDHVDLLLIVGGDGTTLQAVRTYVGRSVPFLPIHSGRVGFLSAMDISHIPDLLPKVLSGAFIREERQLLSVTVYRGKSVLFSTFVLNEAVIGQGSMVRLLLLNAFVDGKKIATFHADGLIVATPTGSTAYALSAGGSIVHPSLPAMIVTPLNPQCFNQKPIVLPDSVLLDVSVIRKADTLRDLPLGITLDGQVHHGLEPSDRVSLTRSTLSVQFLREHPDTFFSALTSKLHWGKSLQ